MYYVYILYTYAGVMYAEWLDTMKFCASTFQKYTVYPSKGTVVRRVQISYPDYLTSPFRPPGTFMPISRFRFWNVPMQRHKGFLYRGSQNSFIPYKNTSVHALTSVLKQ